MNNSDLPAMALTGYAYIDMNGGAHAEGSFEAGMGLTKREHFAGLAMQGMLATRDYVGDEYSTACAKLSVSYADALLKELEK